MKAMVLKKISDLMDDHEPLKPVEMSDPVPDKSEVLIKVSACGVCHTEIDEIEGRTLPPEFPVIPGHQIVGKIIDKGAGVQYRRVGERVGVAWIHSACGTCRFCTSNQENLCPEFKATGRDVNGGYAELTVVPEGFVYTIPDIFSDLQAAPLLCAGAIGYRSLMLTGIRNGGRIGFTGFGASAHIVLMMVKSLYPDTLAYVFARSEREREFAKTLGAVWAGDTDDKAPEKLDCIIDTTPAWKPVVEALDHLKPGGRLIINAIRKEENDKKYLTGVDYGRHLWLEKEIKSVANITRQDVVDFLKIASTIPILPEVESFRLKDANRAIMELKQRKIRGAKVLVME